MQLLLCSASSKYIHSSLAVWYLAESVRQNCSQDIVTDVLECTVNQPIEEILQKIVDKRPDILAFSCYIWNISLVYKLLPQITKLLPKTIMVLGGSEVSHNPKEVLSNAPKADYIICGEGEFPFPLLINRLRSGGDHFDIPGLCFRGENGIVQCNPPAAPLPEPPCPYSDAYFHALASRIAYLETSRGCPFSCAFCLSGISRNVRFFGLERAKKELLLLANSGAQTVKLVDRTFNCNAARANALFRFVIDNAGASIPPGVCFHFEVAADLFGDETLALLASAPPGLIQLEAGLQSFNAKTLETANRKTDLDKLQKNILRLLAPQNIHVHIDLIAGLPYEDLSSFADSFDRAYSLSPHMLQLGFLKMLHGSALRSRAQELGYQYSPLPPYGIWSNPWLSAEDLQTIACAEVALQKLYNSGRFLLTLQYIFNATGLRPFVLFAAFGKEFQKAPLPLSLASLCRLAYEHFAEHPSIDPARLRNALVRDLIACGIKIPDFLKIPDMHYKAALNKIRSTLPKGNKINAALLYADGVQAVYSWGPKSPVTGRHPLRYISAE